MYCVVLLLLKILFMRILCILFFGLLSGYIQGQKSPCLEKVIIPTKYKTVTEQVPQEVKYHKEIVPKKYRIDTTYVEQVPTGRPQPSHLPKQYKAVYNRVPLPCEFKTDEDGNCYREIAIPMTPQTITKKVALPCEFKTDEEGNCYQNKPYLCENAVKCKVRKKIQQALIAKGYDAGKGKKNFATKTMAALKKFQLDNQLDRIPLSLESLDKLGLKSLIK